MRTGHAARQQHREHRQRPGSTTGACRRPPTRASKAAIIGLTRDLAQQWTGRKGIRVNALAPGFFPSEMTAEYPEGYLDQMLWRVPTGRHGEPAELACARSCSSRATRRPTSPASCCRSTAGC